MKYLITKIPDTQKFGSLLQSKGFKYKTDSTSKSIDAWFVDTKSGIYNDTPRKVKAEVLTHAEFMRMLPTMDLLFKVSSIKKGFYIILLVCVPLAGGCIISACQEAWRVALILGFLSLFIPTIVNTLYIVGDKFDTALKGGKTLFK